MAKRKDKARLQAIAALQEHRLKPGSSDALAVKLTENVADFEKDIADTLEIFLGLTKEDMPAKKSNSENMM